MSLAIVIHDPRPAKAEDLLGNVKCVVKGVLSKQCPQPTPATTPSESQPATSPPQAAPPSTSEPVNPRVDPIAIEPVPLPEKISDGRVLPYSSSNHSNAYLANAFTVGGPSRTFGQVEEVVPIQATQQGWLLWSVPWYWWLLIAGIIIGGVSWGVSRIRRHRVNDKD